MEYTRRLEISSLILLLRKKANSYCVGNISNCYENWRSMTLDEYILSIVQNGLLLSFDKDLKFSLMIISLTYLPDKKKMAVTEPI